MPRIGIMLLDEKHDCSFVARRAGVLDLYDVAVYFGPRHGKEYSGIIKSEFCEAMLSPDYRTLSYPHICPSLENVVFVGGEPFTMFDISEKEYGFIMDPDRLDCCRYQQEVFFPWHERLFGRLDDNIRKVLENEQWYAVSNVSDQRRIAEEHSVIQMLSHLRDPALYTARINADKKWESCFSRF